MKYPIAERFKAPQGEGVYTGTPMAFIRFVGCSVGKGVCTQCDTDFEVIHSTLGGGIYTLDELKQWVGDYHHVCLTGGEPFDRDLEPLNGALIDSIIHIETSGTRPIPSWARYGPDNGGTWLTISPKPGYLEDNIDYADEVKVILHGLGDGPGWPTISDAIRWADRGIPTYIQPCNDKLTINAAAMSEAIGVVCAHPQLRLSAQLHKFIKTR